MVVNIHCRAAAGIRERLMRVLAARQFAAGTCPKIVAGSTYP
jgi:hypothetical protein